MPAGAVQQRLRPSLELCRSHPTASKLLGALSVAAVCSVFHVIVVLALLALWPLLSSAAPHYTFYIAPLLLLLSVAPSRPWPTVNRCFELWFERFDMSANTPDVQKGRQYLFALTPHGIFPFWSWPYSSYLKRVLQQDAAVGGGHPQHPDLVLHGVL